MNTKPLRDYLEGVEAFNAGDKDTALKSIASSVGMGEPTEIMKASIDKLVKPNEALMTLILHESKKDEYERL